MQNDNIPNDPVRTSRIPGRRPGGIKILSHRGRSKPLHLEPDNSIEALRQALNNGFDGIELDLRSASDDIVLHHDCDAKDRKDNCIKAVKDIPFRRIRAFHYTGKKDISSWNYVNHVDDIIHLMTEDHDAIYNLEIKDFNTLEPLTKIINERKDDINTSNIYISSFLHDAIVFRKNSIPNAKYGMLMCAQLNSGAFASMIDHYKDNFDFMVMEYEFSNKHQWNMEYIKNKNMEAWAYGIPFSKPYDELKKEGWNAIITDYIVHINK